MGEESRCRLAFSVSVEMEGHRRKTGRVRGSVSVPGGYALRFPAVCAGAGGKSAAMVEKGRKEERSC